MAHKGNAKDFTKGRNISLERQKKMEMREKFSNYDKNFAEGDIFKASKKF